MDFKQLINKMRDKLARFVINTKLPGSIRLWMLIRTKEEADKVDGYLKVVVDGIIKRKVMMHKITATYPELTPLLAGDKGLIFEDQDDKGKLLIESALAVFTNHGEFIEELPEYFKEFVSSPEEFDAVIRHFSSYPLIYQQYGWLSKDGKWTPGFQEMADSGAVMQILEKDLADRLSKNNGKSYDEMLAKVKAYNSKTE